jgi:hypothetical protein
VAQKLVNQRVILTRLMLGVLRGRSQCHAAFPVLSAANAVRKLLARQLGVGIMRRNLLGLEILTRRSGWHRY